MKKIIALILSLLTVICPLMLGGCNNTYYSFSANYFGTSVYAVVKGKPISEETKTKLNNLLSETENSLSINKANSAVNAFNNATETAEVNQTFLTILESSKTLNAFTNGKYNPAVYPISKLWKLTADTFDSTILTVQIPDGALIQEQLLTASKFSEITATETTAVKPDANLKVDFGGIAKGYAVDKIAEILKADGYEEGYINVGGSSIYILSVSEDLEIIHPRKSGERILKVNGKTLTDKPLSTSGDYVRNYKDQTGKYYSHIIDTETGAPADTGFQSVTVIGKSACECDAISTALCAMSKNEFISFVNTFLTDCKVFGVYEKQGEKLLITNEKQDNFTLLDDGFTPLFI